MARLEWVPDTDVPVEALDVSELDTDEVRTALDRLVTGVVQPMGLLVDNVDQAVEPADVVEQALRPLASNP
ncbi:hypothetical protein ACFQV2_06155 [Actinokineospora soli]|uniref:FXSXX-COOH protein n=1 Tax=Actinokineospora soli TaxID=1048753 RepID=A0ABW2THM6_9PSEU